MTNAIWIGLTSIVYFPGKWDQSFLLCLLKALLGKRNYVTNKNRSNQMLLDLSLALKKPVMPR